MKLYFVRHGKTLWNLEGRFQGANGDSPLLESSKDDLRQLARELQDISFDAIYSSDLKRAADTASIIVDEANCKTDISYTKQLREWNLGTLEGTKIATVSAIYPSQMSAFYHNLAQFKPSQFKAESLYETTQRLYQLIKTLENKTYQHVLMVGHGAHLTASIRALLDFEPAMLRAQGGLDNASLTIIETLDFKHFHCLRWNDTSFLQKKATRVTP
ncbi:TPA: histidine phosphatase family protein [Streptococcus equi subsp. zooepidemicus]|nr:histidine phosphatase family protein [Streptococcus equi subsp. zooepidemicus]